MSASSNASEARARDWAIWLTRFGSVTGSPGERDLPHAWADRLRALPLYRDCEIFLIPATDDALGRNCLAVLARGTGERTLLLTGHFDTVPVDDYGTLRDLATDPEPLREALLRQLQTPAGPAEELARQDLESGRFLPGRGLLDMKAGLAAGLAALEEFLLAPDRTGNLLFVAVPDEEVGSAGARALATAMPQILRERGLTLLGGINLDCIGDRGDGTLGRSVALGSVGKLLPTALAIGLTTHASHPLQGVNAAALAGAIAARLEWAPELADDTAGAPGIPPTLLSLKDGKRHYDVTTPEACFAYWNVLTTGRPFAEVFSRFQTLVTEAVAGFADGLAQRQALVTRSPAPPVHIPVVAASQIMEEARRNPRNGEQLEALAHKLAQDGLSLPDQNMALTLEAWKLSGRSGPAVILGLGSLPYPHVELGDTPEATALRAAIETARAWARTQAGVEIGLCRHFPGISDMSFLGDAQTADLGVIAANTPAWSSGVRWSGAVVGVPIINIGPWGRDYHTPLERVETGYAFDLLPRFIHQLVRARLGSGVEAPV
jgi:arginine utilization protein RocB